MIPSIWERDAGRVIPRADVTLIKLRDAKSAPGVKDGLPSRRCASVFYRIEIVEP